MDRRDETEIAARVARRLGLAFTEAVVLYRGTNVLVHLRPAPVVARGTRLAHRGRPLSRLPGAMPRALGDHEGRRGSTDDDARSGTARRGFPLRHVLGALPLRNEHAIGNPR